MNQEAIRVTTTIEKVKTPVFKTEIWREDPVRLVGRIAIRLYSAWVRATYRFASLGRDVEFHPSWDFRKYLAHRVKLGNSVQIGSDVHFGISCADREQMGEAVIVIEDNSIITRRVQISARNRIHIERQVIVSAGVLIMDHNHSYEEPTVAVSEQGLTEGGSIRIGRGSFIGHGAAIVCNRGELTLGQNCIVGANSLVTRSFPSHSVVMGVPAKVIRQYDPSTDAWVVGGNRMEDVYPRHAEGRDDCS